MEERWEKVQLGLHLLLFASGLYLALMLGYLWTGGGDLFGIPGFNRLGGIAISVMQLLARVLLLAAPGRGWGFLALAVDLAGWVVPFLGPGHRAYRALGHFLHVLAGVVSLVQLRQLAIHLERPDLVRWVKRLGALLLATAAGLVVASLHAWLEWPGLGLASVAFGLASVRYLRLVYGLGHEVSKDLRLWRHA